MTPAGWIIMVLACGGFTGLLAWCIHKVVATPEAAEHLHAQGDIDTGDRE
ncbi:MAG: hypothetical protein KA248_00500 [Kiritimatiellae bacterium]|nr:hypothetical protein [Kiritimatiellia bacterium]